MLYLKIHSHKKICQEKLIILNVKRDIEAKRVVTLQLQTYKKEKRYFYNFKTLVEDLRFGEKLYAI